MRFLAVCSAALILVLGGCSGPVNSSSSSAGSNGKTGAGDFKVGVVFDSGGIGDKSFNDSANAGLQRAKQEFGLDDKHAITVQSASERDYTTNLEQMASSGCSVVFAVGLNQGEALKQVAPKYPNVKFAIIDGDVTAPNVRSIHFNEEQGSFLAGYLAALMTKTKKIGFVGGQELDLIKKFEVGYEAGAKTADPSVEVLPAKYVGDWDNSDVAHAEAQTLFGQGADIVYHAAGRAGLGVLKAAKELHTYAIGVDSDQDAEEKGSVLTSMIKHVDESVYQTIKDVKDGTFQPGVKVYDLKGGGVGLSPMTYTKDAIGTQNLAKIDAVSKEISEGKIKVPSTPAELTAYLAQAKK